MIRAVKNFVLAMIVALMFSCDFASKVECGDLPAMPMSAICSALMRAWSLISGTALTRCSGLKISLAK